ncbi:MAG: transglutaminase domain-containing protein, partial [Candidatus Latescibacteria bacterium]|nr:transglutaminase domain-containing protein [Candidatus Latescibacterota bacterium]
MRNYQRCTIIFFVLIIGLSLSVAAQNEQVSWSADAEQIYDTGFMHMLKKHPNGSVSLFNFDLIENDSPGAGRSDKGNAIDSIWGKIRARKILMFDDQRALKSWLYIFPDRHNKHPLHVEINGHKTQFDVISRKGWETVRWIEFPVEWLKKGKNVIDLYCPEAQTEDEAWELQLARADEYEAGGGDPLPVGETSFKSFNDGKSWEQSPFGLEKKDRAEYCVRISLERFVQNGWLESPVIDLWRINSTDLIARMKTIQKLGFSALSDVPEGTTVTYCLRKGTSPSPFSDEWEPYEEIGSGRSVTYDIEGGKYNRRYLQFKVILATDNPLVTPVVKSAEISAEFKESFPVPRHKNIYVIEQNNPPILYSSVKWEWEKWDRPELTKLRKQENLDNVIAGSRTQLEKQMKLLDYAKKRWRWTNPSPEYPEWDALSIVERINKAGGGGMCIQQNLFFVGLCMTYGWQGRLIGVDGHEVCEVWNDDYGKWIYFDAFFPNHILCDIDTGEPLSFLEIHDRYLDYFYSDR